MSVDQSHVTARAGLDPARLRVAGAIKQAANTTGTSFEYLLATAKMESDFNPGAGASTSSAHGLYQFIDQTWLGTVKEAGSQLGYGQYADAITKSSSGNYSVSDPAARREILKLRDDPAAASSMAAVLTQSNSFKLTGKIGRRPTDGELYMAHFMGVGAAAKLISNAGDNPQASAAQMFPSAAAANRPIFYDRSGSARGVSEVYSVLNARYAGAVGSAATRGALALYGDTPANIAVASANTGVASAKPTPAIDNAAYLSTFPDVRAATPVTRGVQRKQHVVPGSDLSLAVSSRRSHPDGFADGARAMGQFLVADVGGEHVVRRADDCGVSRAGSLQRSQRHVQRLRLAPPAALTLIIGK